MLFSIITPYYNNSYCIDRLFVTLSDYFNQDCEIIIVDDCSEPNEYNVLINKVDQSHASNIKILQTEKNSGPGAARKIGVTMAKGNYIAFLDSDDGWIKDRAFLVCDYMYRKKIDICGGGHKIIPKEKFIISRSKSNYCPKNLKRLNVLSWLVKNHFATSSVVVRRKCIIENNFNDDLRYSEDLECWRRIASSYNSYSLYDSGSISFKHVYISDNKLNLSSATHKMQKSELFGMYLLFFNPIIPFYIKLLTPFFLVFSIFKYFLRLIKIGVSKLSR